MAQFIYYVWIGLNIILFVYAFFESILLIFALRASKKSTQKKLSSYPLVTIQLPLYNEKYVVERLIESVCQLDYPKERLEIQLLDDSTDETSDIIQEVLPKYIHLGINIYHHQRKERIGYKAGALEEGMSLCKGEFIAIFDADFIPDREFLKQTLPYFSNKKIAAVQTRWTHLNESKSFLTRAQAIMLNTHFAVEHLGRISSGAFINFNGTAGIWRKKSIQEAGGWHSDTLTEDLDLSFRAQTKGWEFIYLFDSESPAELPVTLDAFKTQQYRWSKGAAECVKKNMGMLWKSPSSLWAKLIGSVHLLNSSLYIVVFLLVLLSPLVFWMTQKDVFSSSNPSFIQYSNLFITFSIPIMFFVGHLLVSKHKWKSILSFPINFYLFLCISISISFYMVIGVIEGFLGVKSAFIRTPKFSLGIGNQQIKEGYSDKKEVNVAILEWLILIYGLGVITLGWKYGNGLIINFGVMITVGYALKVFFAKRVF